MVPSDFPLGLENFSAEGAAGESSDTEGCLVVAETLPRGDSIELDGEELEDFLADMN